MIYIAGDKHGYDAIKIVKQYFSARGIEYVDLGAQKEGEDMPLEEMIPLVVQGVLKNNNNQAILSCGTGVGVEVGANKFSGIRACLATTEKIATWARVYDNCNTLCLVGWELNPELIYKILDSWFEAKYDGSEERLKMIKIFDGWH